MIRKFFIALLVCAQSSAFAQQTNVIQQALHDELDRSMKDLRLDSLAKPFYISCTIQDVKVYSINSVLGGIVNSVESNNRVKGNRVLVGGYDFNDESLDNNLFSTPEANDINVPLDDDYLGIRRAIWVSIDNVYKNAARQFAKNQEMLRDQKKPLAEVPHRSFAKVPPVIITTDVKLVPFDKTKWQQQIKKLSEQFLNTDYPESTVSLSFIQGYTYFVSSEGSSIKTPLQKTVLTATIVGKDKRGEIVVNQVSWCADHPDNLPVMAGLTLQLDLKIKDLDKIQTATKFDDEYNGPVLLQGSSVAEFIGGILFMSRERLVADNNIPGLTGYRNDTRSSIESRIGKNIVSPDLTVKVLSGTKVYNGVTLLGSFEADSEGVPPPKELMLIENGTLRNILNDRTLTAETQSYNGHRDGPGVVQISVNEKNSDKQLKDNLITQAKEAGLEYALIIRDQSLRIGMFNVYKVALATGEETLLRTARLSSLALKNLRKISGSGEEAVYNFPAGNESSFISYIVPKSILIDELDIARAELPSFVEEEYVKSPLKK